MTKRVFVNGTFDILHVGHTRLLNYAATLGELIVAINSDASVRRLKGASRPVFLEHERIEMLLALRVMKSTVHVFNEITPIECIKQNWPINIIVKGNDYLHKQIPERAAFPDIEFKFYDANTTRHTSFLIDHMTTDVDPVPYCTCDFRDLKLADLANHHRIMTPVKSDQHMSYCSYGCWLKERGQ